MTRALQKKFSAPLLIYSKMSYNCFKLRKGVIMNRNFVAKHAKRCGAGVHKAKQGKLISRARQKHLDVRNGN